MGTCCVILGRVTWTLAREWALSFRAAKTVTWVLARDTTVHVQYMCCMYLYTRICKLVTHSIKKFTY